MSFILNLETATKNCSVALAKDGKTITCKEIAAQNFSHAEKLHVFIEEILCENNIQFSDLNAIAVSQGPGSYTGLRIGVSSAKGLCYALNIPMIAIDTLQLLAKQIQIEDGIIIPMIDARRMEVYAAFYNQEGIIQREISADIIDENSYSAILENHSVYFFGNGAEKCKTTLTHPNAKFIDGMYPLAQNMIALAEKAYAEKKFVDVAYFEPFYLKEFYTTAAKI